MFLLVLIVAGIANARGGNDAAGERPPENVNSVPESVRDGGPIVDTTRGKVVSSSLPPKTIALTFDDGPDPKWTPEVLAVLKKYDVQATFFVVGANVTRYPDLVAAIHTSGSELGVHTFSHPDLGTLPRWRVDRELAETQLAIAGAAGVTTFLLRPPYSSVASAIDGPGYDTVLTAGQDGYVSVFTTDDGEDWQRPGVDAIVANATPKPDEESGSIVLMHDAGGDRSETVAALEKYLPAMKAKGYKFTTITGGAKNTLGEIPASPHDRFTGSVLVATLSVATNIVNWLSYLLLVVGALVGIRLVLMLIFARRHARRRRSPDFRWGPPVVEPVTVIVPAYNEIKNIEATVRSILANDHPLEVLVVDDGSTDGTADLVESLALPRVRVLRQRNSGKPKALNAGIRAARHELIIMIDGDTVFEPDTVRLLAQPFADPTIGGVAGNVKIANRDELIGRMQHIEYVIGFNIDRRVQDETGSIATVPGAGGAFRRKALLEVGGLSTDTLAEDTDLTIALGRAGWRVVFEEHARAWTEAPATMSQLYRQRYRWSYGTMQAMWKHRRAIREHGAAGKVGRRGLANVAAFQILLPLTAPLVDVFFLFGLLFADPALTLLLGAGMLGVQLLGAMYAFRLEGEPMDVLWVFPAQQIVYRQLMYTVLIRSVASAVSGVRVRWKTMNRIGSFGNLVPGPAGGGLVPGPAGAVLAPGQAGGGKPQIVDDRTVPMARVTERDLEAARRPKPKPKRHVVATGRERWFDLLRLVALARVIATEAGAPATITLFPAWGVLFGIAGSLLVRSSQHSPEIDVIGHRLRRLLVPLWAFGIIAVPIMLWQGWANATDDNTFYVANLVFWIFPFLDPPGSTGGLAFTGGLWFIRASVWFVLLTPLMRNALRRWPTIALLTPLAIVGLDAGLGWDLSGGGGTGPALIDFCTYATCWMLGMAYRDGTLRKLHPVLLTFLGAAAIAGGIAWTMYKSKDLDVDAVPLGQALLSAGVVILVLVVSRGMAWLDRIPLLGGLLTIIADRALTIYLCFPVAFAAAPLVDARLGLAAADPRIRAITSACLILVGVLLFGWIEDVAARRPPRVFPNPRRHAVPDRPEGRTPTHPPQFQPQPVGVGARAPELQPREQAAPRPAPLPAPRSAAPAYPTPPPQPRPNVRSHPPSLPRPVPPPQHQPPPPQPRPAGAPQSHPVPPPHPQQPPPPRQAPPPPVRPQGPTPQPARPGPARSGPPPPTHRSGRPR
jgi:cellulose synthase/poly-beta-1,6-N-acetylglucosamine synthase-like glycosyltransferase/peptidoglycan/xylan/chitin deacetylase (PgdA/CDA1 family)